MGRKKRSSNWKWVLPALALLAAAGLLAAYFITPGVPLPQVGEGDVLIAPGEDGGILLSWPAAPEGAASRVSLRRAGEQAFEVLGDFSENQVSLEEDVLSGKLSVRVQSVAQGKNLLGMDREMVSRRALEVSVQPRNLVQPTLEGRTGSEGDLHLSWNGAGGYEVSTVEDGRYTPVCRVNGDKTVIRFGEDGDLDLPEYDQTVWISIRAAYQGEGYVLYGPYAQPVSVDRTALMGNVLSLVCRNLGERLYALEWNETKGGYYEVQEWSASDKSWETLARVEHGEELRYETGLLRSGSDHRYRVAAMGAAETVEPGEVSFRTEISTKYATIWPVVDLDFCGDEELKKSLGTIPAGTALCVLEEGDDCFQVRWKDQYGYVDSRFCMINLPEYVGDVCAYDMTNSYSSIFMVHDYPIEHITGEVIKGFEGVRTEDGDFLVPFLYPSAKKLLTAARAAEEDGYRLRIYEAFRPNEATRFLYDTTMAQLDYPLPELGEDGAYVFYVPPEPAPETEPAEEPASTQEPDAEPVLPPDEAVGEGQAEPASQTEPDSQTEPASQTEPGAEASPDAQMESTAISESAPPEEEGGLQEETHAEPEPEIPTGPTYRKIMTDGRFGISSFLAASVSAHNRGIALDMTIEGLDGSPMEMQSAMHDLSWYSAAYRNNDNAKLLESYMTGVGMRGLSSEWWHFQDDATREAIGLSKYLYKGVTAEGWTRDNVGWRYRAADGSFRKSTNITVDGKQYTLDQEGYAVE